MNIEITTELINKLKEEGFYLDEMFSAYFTLQALYENEIELLDNYDDFNLSKRAMIIYQTLYRKGFIEKNKEGGSLMFKLSDKGLKFVQGLQEVKKKKIDCSEWIEEWTHLFPEKNNKDRVLRSEPIDCEDRMNQFMRKYKYTKEVIFAATKSYLASESAKGYEYAKEAMFFITRRGEGSKLAAWCQNVLSNKSVGGRLADGMKANLIQTVN